MRLGTTGTAALAGAALAVLFAAPAAHAQKTIALTAVDGYPPRALQVRTFLAYLIPEVDKRLAKSGEYKINWNKAFAGQIVKVRHVMTGMQKGWGDIGVVTRVSTRTRCRCQAVADCDAVRTAEGAACAAR